MTTATEASNAPGRTGPRPARRRHGIGLITTAALAAVAGLAVTPDRSAEAAVPDTARHGAESSRAQLDRLARTLVDAGAPGVIVRVDNGRGRPMQIAKQAAWTRPDHRLVAGDEFRMGSNTKTMVATLVLQLVTEGRCRRP